MKEKLTNVCTYPEAWSEKNGQRYPAAEMGYMRAYHDKYRWWNTAFPVHPELHDPKLIKEFDRVYNAFAREFEDLAAVERFFSERGEQIGPDEYNAYLELKYGFYWFRVRIGWGDYNLHLHCLSRAELLKARDGRNNDGETQADHAL